MLCFFLQQKTEYEMRISDWSSDVCSSDHRQIMAPVINRMTWTVVRAVDDALMCADWLPLGDDLEAIGIDAQADSAIGERGRRSEERRVGNECVSTWRSRWSP